MSPSWAQMSPDEPLMGPVGLRAPNDLAIATK